MLVSFIRLELQKLPELSTRILNCPRSNVAEPDSVGLFQRLEHGFALLGQFRQLGGELLAVLEGHDFHRPEAGVVRGAVGRAVVTQEAPAGEDERELVVVPKHHLEVLGLAGAVAFRAFVAGDVLPAPGRVAGWREGFPGAFAGRAF